MLAARAAAEIVAGDQDGTAGVTRIIEDVAGLRADGFKGALAEPFARDGLQPMRGDDDVCIDILRAPRIGAARNLADPIHYRAVLVSVGFSEARASGAGRALAA